MSPYPRHASPYCRSGCQSAHVLDPALLCSQPAQPWSGCCPASSRRPLLPAGPTPGWWSQRTMGLSSHLLRCMGFLVSLPSSLSRTHIPRFEHLRALTARPLLHPDLLMASSVRWCFTNKPSPQLDFRLFEDQDRDLSLLWFSWHNPGTENTPQIFTSNLHKCSHLALWAWVSTENYLLRVESVWDVISSKGPRSQLLVSGKTESN